MPGIVRCCGITKAGKRCRWSEDLEVYRDGNSYCFWHNPAYANERWEWGQRQRTGRIIERVRARGIPDMRPLREAVATPADTSTNPDVLRRVAIRNGLLTG